MGTTARGVGCRRLLTVLGIALAGASSGCGSSAETGGDGGSDAGPPTEPALCPDPLPPGWIFCDDFEQGRDVTRYSEAYGGATFYWVDTEGRSGSSSMEVDWQENLEGPGGLHVTFGDNPAGSLYRDGEDFNDIYTRMFVKHQAGWTGTPGGGMMSVTSNYLADNSQAMNVGLGSGLVDALSAQPSSCVQGGTPICTGWNDYDNFAWLAPLPGVTSIFSTEDSGNWRCVELHVELNTPGQSDGVVEFWVDGNLENSARDLDLRGSYTDHGINKVLFFNWWTGGAPTAQLRWFDDLAIATERIGCD